MFSYPADFCKNESIYWTGNTFMNKPGNYHSYTDSWHLYKKFTVSSMGLPCLLLHGVPRVTNGSLVHDTPGEPTPRAGQVGRAGLQELPCHHPVPSHLGTCLSQNHVPGSLGRDPCGVRSGQPQDAQERPSHVGPGVGLLTEHFGPALRWRHW